MEIAILQGVCNNSPAEWPSSENGWRSSSELILGQLGKRVRFRIRVMPGWVVGRGCWTEACRVSGRQPAPSADLG